MAGRRKHALRSRKTFRARMREAAIFLTGSLPFEVRQSMGLRK